MKILDKYIAKQILSAIFSVLGILIIVVGLLDLVDEIKKVNNEYPISLAFLYVILNIPQNIYEVLPIATLMGSLIGLSKLSSTSELNAAKSSGLSFSKIILIDPVFSSSASPFSWLIKRYQPPVFKMNELPKIDFILISHDHYDHLDMNTIKFFNKNKDVSFVVPLGVGSHLKKWGVSSSRITEMDWWENKVIKDINFICTPAQHFSGRKGFVETQKSLWASWVVKSGKRSFYFSGDSGYSKHYKEIGKKYGPMELVFMDSGQYNTRWRSVHNMPDEVIKGFIDVKGENLIPIHWGMFTLAMHNWFDPPVEIEKRAKEQNISLITPIIGQVIDMENLIVSESWWEKLIDLVK